ncbi:MAG: NADH-quinone oxidoreductase subunit C [Candidatus Ozemobacteraceae bacterium]
MNEEQIRSMLMERCGVSAEAVVIQRARRINVDVSLENVWKILPIAQADMQFTFLLTITGLDEGETFGFIYHLARQDGIVMNLKTHAPKSDPTIKTITELYNGGAIYERELVDMFGVKVEGLPPGNRYPLPENWPPGQYPLRKDWKPEMLDAALKEEKV